LADLQTEADRLGTIWKEILKRPVWEKVAEYDSFTNVDLDGLVSEVEFFTSSREKGRMRVSVGNNYIPYLDNAVASKNAGFNALERGKNEQVWRSS